MLTMQVQAFGGPEALVPVEAPVPVAGPGQVLIEQKAIGVNFVDLQHRSGKPYPMTVPFVPGIEAAGVIAALGEGVAGFAVGDRVAYGGPMPGAYGQFVSIAADRVVPLPPGTDFDTAAAVTLQGMTAHYLSHDAHPIMPGQWVFVHAASGGVGTILAQYAKAMGARVIGGTSDAGKLAGILERGADHAILVTESGLADKVRELTGGGVHAVYDSLGGPYFDMGLKMLRARGSNVVYGLAAGPIPTIDVSILSGFYGTGNRGSIKVSWTSLGDHTETHEDLISRAHAVYADARNGLFDVRIAEVIPLAEAARAHAGFNAITARGKIILRP